MWLRQLHLTSVFRKCPRHSSLCVWLIPFISACGTENPLSNIHILPDTYQIFLSWYIVINPAVFDTQNTAVHNRPSFSSQTAPHLKEDKKRQSFVCCAMGEFLVSFLAFIIQPYLEMFQPMIGSTCVHTAQTSTQPLTSYN